jgi:hypothetical protein
MKVKYTLTFKHLDGEETEACISVDDSNTSLVLAYIQGYLAPTTAHLIKIQTEEME